MKAFYILMLLVCIGSTQPLLAQQALEANINDHLLLEADVFRGTIQWQDSVPGGNWTDIALATTATSEILIVNLPVFFRARVAEPNCDPHFSEVIAVHSKSAEMKLWSDPATWNGEKPIAGQHVTIAENQHIILDEDPPPLGSLTIAGTLRFARKNINLQCGWILVHGALEIGTEAEPFSQKATITLTATDTNESIMGMGTRGIIVMDGRLDLHGATPAVLWTKVNAHVEKNATQLELAVNPSWKVNDEIVVGPTDFFGAAAGASVSQQFTITALSGNIVTLSSGMNAFRWGKLQYATSSGMSLTEEGRVIPPASDTPEKQTPTVLDERAPVGNLTRTVLIQGADDGVWRDQGFGAHVMVSGPNAKAYVEGVEIRRCGQRGKLARYGFHFHMLSYSGSQTLNDAAGQYLRNSSIHGSANRGIVIHGTNGVSVKNNIVFDIKGHGFFTEDAVERRNTFDENLVLMTRNPSGSAALKQHETGERGSAGFWISNPDNTLINNTAADCQSNGFWMAFTMQPWGLNNSVLNSNGLLVNPSRLKFGVFNNNTAHSNRLEGIMIDNVESDVLGNTIGFQYSSTTDDREPTWNSGTRLRFTLSNYNVWKNGSNGIWDRAVWPDNYGVVSADNCGRFFAGSGSDGVIERSLVIGTSLNHLKNNTDRPTFNDTQGGNQTPAAFATYHSTFDIKDNIIVNFPLVANTRSGAFATEDYYTRGVEKGQYRNTNNLLIQTHPGVKLKSVFNYFNLASALWDPHGTWGPAGNYFVYDVPFLTYGLSVTPVAPGPTAGGVSVPGPFYGFSGFVLHGVGDTPPKNQPYNDLMAIHVRRLDSNLNEVDVWHVNAAQQDWLLAHMRSFATHPSGIYELIFPDQAALPNDFQMDVENMLTTDDMVVIAIQFDGAVNAGVRMASYTNRNEMYQQAESREAVRQSAGATYWQDKANNLVWVKLRGGFWQFWTANTNEAIPSSDDLLYEQTVLKIYPK